MRLADLSGRRVALWGFGREGRAALRALRQLTLPPSALVVVSDSEPSAEERAGAPDLEWSFGPGAEAALLDADVVIRSPGISRYRDDATRVAAMTTVTTGTNLWFAEHVDDSIIAVTGSKGKSTTSSLIAHLAGATGRDVTLAGNIGVALLDHLHPQRPPDLWVLELSSHQTSDLSHSPRVGVLLNLYREHVDWHGTEERYFEDKLNLFGHRVDGVAVLNAEDENTRRYQDRLSNVAWFGTEEGYHTDGSGVLWSDQSLIASDRLHLRGRHNLLNICAGLAALDRIGIDPRRHVDALSTFRPLRHRLETIGVIEGVTYVNDSISTIPEAAMAALETTVGRPTILLAGGFHPDQDFSPLAARLRQSHHVVAVIAMPPSGRRLARAIEAVPGTPPVVLAEDLADAVARARDRSRPGMVVLLSPAAPSYGSFRDFETRGDAFRELVSPPSSPAAGTHQHSRGGTKPSA